MSKVSLTRLGVVTDIRHDELDGGQKAVGIATQSKTKPALKRAGSAEAMPEVLDATASCSSSMSELRVHARAAAASAAMQAHA
jgi:hypothetical protein